MGIGIHGSNGRDGTKAQVGIRPTTSAVAPSKTERGMNMTIQLREGVHERTCARMVIMACQMVDKIRGLEKALEEAEMAHFLEYDTKELVQAWTDASATVKAPHKWVR